MCFVLCASCCIASNDKWQMTNEKFSQCCKRLLRPFDCLMELPMHRGNNNLFLGLTSVVGLIGGAYLLQCGAKHLLRWVESSWVGGPPTSCTCLKSDCCTCSESHIQLAKNMASCFLSYLFSLIFVFSYVLITFACWPKRHGKENKATAQNMCKTILGAFKKLHIKTDLA